MKEDKLERKLHQIFDYQRFAENPRLARLIAQAEADCEEPTDVCDDDLEQVWAAGDQNASHASKPKEEGHGD